MRYAVIENGVVINILWLYPGNAKEFPSAISLEEPSDARPVTLGDTFTSGQFTRNGETVLTRQERAQATIAELDEAVVDLTYQNVLLEFGI